MVKVIKGSVRRNKDKYPVGAIINGLSKRDEDRLIEKGICEAVSEGKSKKTAKSQEESDPNGKTK